MIERAVDGKLSLTDQLHTLGYAENQGPYKLIAYDKTAAVAPDVMNKASFVDLPLGQDVKDLVLVEVAESDSIGAVVNGQAGKELVDISHVFVEGEVKVVAIFR